MNSRPWLIVLVSALACGAAAAQPARPRVATDAELVRVRAGFDQKVRQMLESERGKPLVRAEKRPPLGPGRGNYVRAYSFSIVDFATRCLVLNEQVKAANAALIENAEHYLANPKDIGDRDSFHWHSDMLLRLVEMFGSRGTVARGRLSAEAEAKIMAVVWEYARRRSTFEAAEVEQSRTWHIHESENHHAQEIVTLWHFAKLASQSPEYRDRTYDAGGTPQEHYNAWSRYLNTYAVERAKRGLAVEVASDNYQVIGLKGFYNVYDFAEDAALRKRFGYLIDLYWALWAQEQFNGVLGGGRRGSTRAAAPSRADCATHGNWRGTTSTWAIGRRRSPPCCPRCSARIGRRWSSSTWPATPPEGERMRCISGRSVWRNPATTRRRSTACASTRAASTATPGARPRSSSARS